MKHESSFTINNQQGQVLLIIIMLMAVALTIVTAVTFKSTTETQTTKLEEEAQKSLAAAEAGVEAGLKRGSIADISTLNLGTGVSGSVTVATVRLTEFTTPLLQQDSQYTFYLSTPGGTVDDPDFTTLTSPFYNNKSMTVCFGTGVASAVELTFVKSDYSVVRYVINPSGSAIVDSGTTANGGGSCPSGTSFTSQHNLTSAEVSSNNYLLIIRTLGGGGKIGLKSATSADNFPIQGRTVTSEAGYMGISKRVELFQSYPQIPAEFFVTSF